MEQLSLEGFDLSVKSETVNAMAILHRWFV